MNPENIENLANPENVEFDRELQQALAVEPSTDFLAQARMRLATARRPAAWRRPRMVVSMGMLAAAVVAAILVLRPHEQKPSSPAHMPSGVEPGEASQNPAHALGSRTAGVTGGASQSTAVLPPAAVRPRAAGAHATPDVLVSKAEMTGLHRLIALASRGDSSLEFLLAEPAGVAPTQEMPEFAPILNMQEKEIVIAPIVIDPLTPDTY